MVGSFGCEKKVNEFSKTKEGFKSGNRSVRFLALYSLSGSQMLVCIQIFWKFVKVWFLTPVDSG